MLHYVKEKLNLGEISTHAHERKEEQNDKGIMMHAYEPKTFLMKWSIEDLLLKGELNEKDAMSPITKQKRSPIGGNNWRSSAKRIRSNKRHAYKGIFKDGFDLYLRSMCIGYKEGFL